MNTLVIHLTASTLLRRVVLFAHLPVLASVWLLAGDSWRVLAGVAILAAHAWWQDRRLASNPISALSVHADQCRICHAGQWRDASLHSATVFAWFTQIRLTNEGKPYHLFLLADNTDPDAFRRLRIWLRWDSPLATGREVNGSF